jgi:putative oxidoreductase
MNTTLAAWEPRALSILRIVTALLFLQHGLTKLFGFPGSALAHLELMTLLGIGGIIEFVAGALLTLGLFTRVTAFVACGEMAAAYFMSHAPRAFFPLLNGGELAIMFCFVFFYLMFAGPGPWSIDTALQTGRSRKTGQHAVI